MDKKEYKLPAGFKAYECMNFYDSLSDVTRYEPCKLGKQQIEKQFKKLIKFVVIDAPLWTKFKAYWKKYFINLSYGFYDIKENTIFINIRAIGINATKDCSIITPTSNKLKRLSEIIAHEYIHYQFQTHTERVLARVKSDLLLFYKTYWKNVVDDSILNPLYKAHFYIAANTNKNATDPILGKLTKIQIDRFLRILNNIKDNYNHKILAKQTFYETIDVIENILHGTMFSSDLVTSKILKSYKLVLGDFPPRYLQVGQELILVSEILSVCANMHSSKAKNIVKSILAI